MEFRSFFEKFANKATIFTGSSSAFIIALTIVIVWLISGPFLIIQKHGS